MLLSELELNEKKIFWFLANKLITVDNEISIQEEQYMDGYLVEMNAALDELLLDETIEGVISAFPKISYRRQRIIYIELYALAYCDLKLEDNEIDFLNTIQNVASITDDEISKIDSAIKEIMDAYSKIGGVINE